MQFAVGRALGAVVWLACASLLAVQPAWATVQDGGTPELLVPVASAETLAVAQWVLESHDNRGLPFVIVDKKDARLVVFAPGGAIVGTTPALLGLAAGDDAVPGLGARPLAQITPAERTTPAGRFASEPGRNLSGEAVVWFDYDAGLAIHRIRPGSGLERREQRLASATPADNRISLGCIVVAESFYDDVIAPLLGRSRGVVYVLPETRTAAELFGGYRLSLRQGD